MNKIKFSVRIQDDARQKMFESLIKKRYGLKGKSKWVEEAITKFLKITDYEDLVDIAANGEVQKHTIVESFYFTSDTANLIDDALKHIRIKYPMTEGVKSHIIRASILQRLIRD